MAGPLPRLRTDLDVMPSPIPEQPGLLVRDPFRYSDATLIVPPLLARCLSYFDGAHDQDDLRARLASLTGTIKVADVAKQLVTALSEAGFLEDDRFAALREAREQAFAAGDERVPAHAGSGYPDEPAALRARLDGYHAAAPGKKPRRRARRRRAGSDGRDRRAARQPRRRIQQLRRRLSRAARQGATTASSSSSERPTTASPTASG